MSIGFSLVGGRLAPAGRSGKGASGAGVGCMELHNDWVLERVDEARDPGWMFCDISGNSSVSSTVEFFLDFMDMLEGCECSALARLSEAVDCLACRRAAEVDETMGDASAEFEGTGVDRADSNAWGWPMSGLAPREANGLWATCVALLGRLGIL